MTAFGAALSPRLSADLSAFTYKVCGNNLTLVNRNESGVMQNFKEPRGEREYAMEDLKRVVRCVCVWQRLTSEFLNMKFVAVLEYFFDALILEYAFSFMFVLLI